MKELSIEEKAKRYDELKVTAQELEDDGCFDKITLFDLFPELKESDDERIRKALIEYFRWNSNGQLLNEFTNREVFAWLEKQGEQKSIDDLTQQEAMDIAVGKCFEQGEQKPVDKVEPKFKSGDWVVYDGWICQIIDVTEDGYCNSQHGFIPKNREDSMRLWTIQDAKDGDVLCGYPYDDFPWIGIFHELNADYTFSSYCYLQAGINGKFCHPSGINIFNRRNVDAHSSEYVLPATKEQRDTLEKAMADAGYTFDFEKKELKKIEQKFDMKIPFGAKDSELQEWFYSIPEGFYAEIKDNKVFIKKGEQKPADKVEPKFKVGDIVQYITDSTDRRRIEDVDELCNMYHTDSSPIMFEVEGEWKVVVHAEDVEDDSTEFEKKELKKIEQKPAWSEEDEEAIGMAIIALYDLYDEDSPDTTYGGYNLPFNKAAERLKSLKNRYTWKPSDEQMGVIEAVINNRSFQRRHLDSLYEQLKKLR